MARNGTKRADIINSATRLFAEKGHTETTIRDISADSGAGLGLITYYFKDKEAILNEVLMDNLKDLGPVFAAEVNNEGSYAARLKRIYSVYCDFGEENPLGTLLLLRGILRLIEGEANPIVGFFAARLEAIRKVLDGGREAGEFRKIDTEFAPLMLVSGLMSQAINNLANERYPDAFPSTMSSRDNTKLFENMILRGLLLKKE